MVALKIIFKGHATVRRQILLLSIQSAQKQDNKIIKSKHLLKAEFKFMDIFVYQKVTKRWLIDWRFIIS